MSLARTVTSFCIDISPSMGARRLVTEEVVVDDGRQEATMANYNDGGLAHAAVARDQSNAAEQSGIASRIRQRETTDLEWVMEFVAKKVQTCILSGLKTAKVYLVMFGSPRTNAKVLDALRAEKKEEEEEEVEGYEGVDEIWLPDQPTMSTLELVRLQRAARKEENPPRADPLDALVAAITTLNDKSLGGVTNTWKRTIYLITDGKTEMNTGDMDLIRNRLIEDNIALKVIGIDFDDEEIGFKEEDKEPQKAKNESWWRDYLKDIPGADLATAAKVIAQASIPTIQLQGSAPYSTSLTFGDPAARHEGDDVMDIPVKMYKATAIARPLSQKKLSKIAQDSAAARRETEKIKASASQMRPSSTLAYPSQGKRFREEDEPDDGLTYGVHLQKKYFLKEDLENVEGGINAAEPLPEGAEATFDRAYKLGATLVAINDDLERKQDTKAGIEIVQFTNKALYRRHYHMSETWFVFASETSVKAEVQLGSLIRAMWQQEKYAVVRFVRRDGTEPKLGILAPQIRDEAASIDFECFFFVEAPFREDLKRFTFPPLDRVINREGKELYEHSSLPSKEMQDRMDDLVDAMDLMDAEQDEESGELEPWFRCEDSYNPAIHGIKEAVSWRVFHAKDKSLPKPHFEVTKYLSPPKTVVDRSADVAEKCRALFDLQYVPTMASKRQARRREGAQNEEPKEIDLEGVMDDELAAEEAASNQARTEAARAVDARQDENEGETVVEEEPTASISLDEEDPVKDFDRKLGDSENDVGDVISAMCARVRTTIKSSFGSNDYSLARDMLLALRRGAIDYEEAGRYNTFIKALKSSLLATQSAGRSRKDFWDNFVRGEDRLSLIRDDEAIGERTGVNANAAGEFINL